MSDSASKASDCFQLLRTLQLLLQILSLHNISRYTLNSYCNSTFVNQPGVHFYGDTPTVLRNYLKFVSALLFACEFAPNHLPRLLNIFGRDCLRDAHCESLFERIACDSLSGFIERGVAAFQIVRVDDVLSIFHKIAVTLFALFKRSLEPPALQQTRDFSYQSHRLVRSFQIIIRARL